MSGEDTEWQQSNTLIKHIDAALQELEKAENWAREHHEIK